MEANLLLWHLDYKTISKWVCLVKPLLHQQQLHIGHHVQKHHQNTHHTHCSLAFVIDHHKIAMEKHKGQHEINVEVNKGGNNMKWARVAVKWKWARGRIVVGWVTTMMAKMPYHILLWVLYIGISPGISSRTSTLLLQISLMNLVTLQLSTPLPFTSLQLATHSLHYKQ